MPKNMLEFHSQLTKAAALAALALTLGIEEGDPILQAIWLDRDKVRRALEDYLRVRGKNTDGCRELARVFGIDAPAFTE